MSFWSRYCLLQFIEKYRGHGSIWKIKAKEYRNRDMREAAYQDLLNFVKKVDPQAAKDSVVKKNKQLTEFIQKRAEKIICSQKSGMGTEDAYVPKLWYFNELNFLRDQEEAMEGVSNLDGSDQEELSIDVTSEQNTCSPRTTQVSSAQRFAQQADNLSFSESTPSGPSGAVTSKPFKRAKPLTPTDQLNWKYNCNMGKLRSIIYFQVKSLIAVPYCTIWLCITEYLFHRPYWRRILMGNEMITFT
ncbi:uncharacterized protein LOC124165851 [Ischnura elegans]|uniref:uncharacterized protein LOC124165851 n=1 Tax=Ischnura elegans TaxID=197161 RepID=UPI001ED88C01|nr:uncharacterized protein LOC124165851 [Ischnura elegans]